MTTSARRPVRGLASLAAAAATAATLAGTTTAADAAPARSTITVQASDTTVAPGEQLVLTGNLSHAPGRVAVATRTASGWQRLTGAVVSTRSNGDYRVRVVLSRPGVRELRVLGDPAKPGIGSSTRRVTVHVG